MNNWGLSEKILEEGERRYEMIMKKKITETEIRPQNQLRAKLLSDITDKVKEYAFLLFIKGRPFSKNITLFFGQYDRVISFRKELSKGQSKRITDIFKS